MLTDRTSTRIQDKTARLESEVATLREAIDQLKLENSRLRKELNDSAK